VKALTVFENLPKIPIFGPSLIYQLRLIPVYTYGCSFVMHMSGGHGTLHILVGM
jgi:hypothetical protein